MRGRSGFELAWYAGWRPGPRSVYALGRAASVATLDVDVHDVDGAGDAYAHLCWAAGYPPDEETRRALRDGGWVLDPLRLPRECWGREWVGFALAATGVAGNDLTVPGRPIAKKSLGVTEVDGGLFDVRAAAGLRAMLRAVEIQSGRAVPARVERVAAEALRWRRRDRAPAVSVLLPSQPYGTTASGVLLYPPDPRRADDAVAAGFEPYYEPGQYAWIASEPRDPWEKD